MVISETGLCLLNNGVIIVHDEVCSELISNDNEIEIL